MKNKTTIAWIIGAIVFFIFMVCAGEIYHETHCSETDCFEERMEGSEYCEVHDKENYPHKYVTKKTTTPTKTCLASGCNRSRVQDSSYCYDHKCRITSCNHCVVSESRYCAEHSKPFTTTEKITTTTKKYNGYNDSPKSYDPDDYDIDGYYGDYKSDYKSYDEAWEGFEDGDSDWED